MTKELSLTPEERTRLCEAAAEARRRAYARYSHFTVGAALLAQNGQIYSGCNVENASYGLTICAERVALFSAISQGQAVFRAIAIATSGGHAPCGACRQVLAEFCDDLVVLMFNVDQPSDVQKTSLGILLPSRFVMANDRSRSGGVA